MIGRLVKNVRDRLRSNHVLGMNRRNLEYIQALNPRAHFALADDKILAKELLVEHGLPVPETLAVVRLRAEVDGQLDALQDCGGFVLKPSRGFGGSGILVASASQGRLSRPSGRLIGREELRLHMVSILAGMFAQDHFDDRVLIERLVVEDPDLSEIHGGIGVSDLRVIAQNGKAVMAMLRLPCRRSHGTANLHQHGLGLGVNLDTGVTSHAVQDDREIDRHPDTGTILRGIAIPGWRRAIEIAEQVNHVFGMDYLGADIVFDAERGPLILEVNVRPGLAIQLANHRGLRAALEKQI